MRNFVNTQNTNLERDAEGHRTGFKIYIKVRKPMSVDGFSRWGTKQKVHVGKSKYIWKYYSSSRSLGYVQGIPIENCKTDKALITFLITFAGLGEGETYAIHGWRGKSKRYPIPLLTRALIVVTIQDVEKMAFKVTKTRMGRYWFRKTDDRRHMEREE